MKKFRPFNGCTLASTSSLCIINAIIYCMHHAPSSSPRVLYTASAASIFALLDAARASLRQSPEGPAVSDAAAAHRAI
eukprot:760467-Pleurochrysis_carterae.AAC.1